MLSAWWCSVDQTRCSSSSSSPASSRSKGGRRGESAESPALPSLRLGLGRGSGGSKGLSFGSSGLCWWLWEFPFPLFHDCLIGLGGRDEVPSSLHHVVLIELQMFFMYGPHLNMASASDFFLVIRSTTSLPFRSDHDPKVFSSGPENQEAGNRSPTLAMPCFQVRGCANRRNGSEKFQGSSGRRRLSFSHILRVFVQTFLRGFVTAAATCGFLPPRPPSSDPFPAVNLCEGSFEYRWQPTTRST